MNSKSKFRPSPALVISCVALFLALAGSAFAAKTASISSRQIVDATVRTIDLRDNAVTSPKIADATITANDLGTNSVGSDEIAENAVASPEVADQSLTADDLGADSVGSSEIQAGAIRSSELGPIIQVSNSTPIAANGGNASVTATCPAGTTVISGGAQPGNFGVELTSTLRNGNGWEAQARDNNAAASTLTAFAYCLTGGSSN